MSVSLQEKRLDMRGYLVRSGGVQVALTVMGTVIGVLIHQVIGGIVGFAIGYLIMGIQTLGMWGPSNLHRCMIRAGQPRATSRKFLILGWPIYWVQQMKFVVTDAYTPDF